MTSIASSSPDADAGLAGRLDSVIEEAVHRELIVGAVVLMLVDGEMVYRRAAGMARRETGRAMGLDAIFRLASVTKPMVSAAALAMIARGQMALDDPVTRYLPQFTPRLPNGSCPTITIRHLLTHTAGLSYDFLQPLNGTYHRHRISAGMDQPGLGTEEHLARISSVPLICRPGEQFSYSVATDVLGAAMASAAGIPLPELVAGLITRPLAMTDTGFAAHAPERLVGAYADGAGSPVPMGASHRVPNTVSEIAYAPDRWQNPDSFASGGAGMLGTAQDFARFLEALRLGGAPILDAPSLALLTQNAIGDLEIDPLALGWRFSHGFSILRDPVPTQTPHSPGTWQWGGAYGHYWFVDPQRKTTLVALTNTAIAGMAGYFPMAIRDAAYGVQTDLVQQLRPLHWNSAQ